MARMSRKLQLLALLALVAPTLAQTTDTGLPDLATLTATTATSASSATTSSTTDATATTDETTTADTTATTDATFATDATSATDGAASSTSDGGVLTGAPTIAGAGVPTMIVPYTADAPFMQKSTLPTGTVFIAVGAVLAFLGACVLLWRGLVAWSINRSVRKSAMASIRGSEKHGRSAWGGTSGYNQIYKDTGNSLSMDALTSNGKPMHKPHFRDHDIKRESTPPPGLFFSPTAQAGAGGNVQNHRASTLLPAGYYASPSAQAAGGAATTTVGGSLAPYARDSTHNPSPPPSPGMLPQSRGSAGQRGSSRDGLRAPGSSRDGYNRNSYLDGTPRASRGNSAIFQQRTESPAGQRAPSAYLDDLFQNHGNGPRERF